MNIAKSFVKTLKRTFLWRSFFFLFGEEEWAKNIVEQKTTRIAPFTNTPNHPKKKHQVFADKRKDKDLLCFFCTYTKLLLSFKRPPTNDRTCMGWHTRHASIHFGAGGTFTSRDAKPNGLESCFGTSSLLFIYFI